ncbi:MAG TPA: UDP-glucose--hexose-1-phosphate uridylyltransferase [Terriglobales bacterium]|nr:UDP-glucose--hexose-1-phosphate uridylyltransferase [Terriglobales bacterium]
MSRDNVVQRRYNPLLDEWVLVSPGRQQRPWQGEVSPPDVTPRAVHDPDCYLCPGAPRASGQRNPDYRGVYVFDNDFPALTLNRSPQPQPHHPLLRAEPEAGVCRVVCFSPRHDLSLSRLPQPAVEAVVASWTGQYAALGALDEINAVMIFENRGAMMGCSNPHPHGQIWASQSVPNFVARERHALIQHQRAHGECMLCAYGRLEAERRERLVCENDSFIALVPYWAVWPFETLVVSRRHRPSLSALTATEASQLADILRQVTIRYDNLFGTEMPYSFGLHQALTDGADNAEAHLHAHFLPPLLRSASIRKFLVGYELLATPQRDLTAETAAERLRAVSDRHYSEENAR